MQEIDVSFHTMLLCAWESFEATLGGPNKWSNSGVYTVPFRSIRPGGGQGDRLDEIWTSAILRVDWGHLPDFGQSKSSAACASSRTDPRVIGDLATAIDLK